MPDYQKGKIYKLVSNVTNKIYIGSTTQTLDQRKQGHEKDYRHYINTGQNYVSSFNIIEDGNYDIVLLENYPCDNESQLFKREGHWQKNMECVNKNIAGRTVQEYYADNKDTISKYLKEYCVANKDTILENQRKYCAINKETISKYHKEYQENNKEVLSKRHKEYYANNKEQICDRIKQYRDTHKDRIKEYRDSRKDIIKQRNAEYRANNKDKIKQYTIDNAEKIKQRQTVKITCECGTVHTASVKARHLRTQKHLNYVKLQQTNQSDTLVTL